MKVTAGAVLLGALSGVTYAIPLPIGVLDNVQDNCAGMGSGCVPAGPFLHHLADSETKYLHLVHPETGSVMHVVAPSGSLAASTSASPSSSGSPSTGDSSDDTPSTKPAAGVYPSSNHPSTSTPFTEPPSMTSSNNTSVGLNSKSASLMADDSIGKPQDDDQALPVKPAGMSVAPNSTIADKTLANGPSTQLPGATTNMTSTDTPSAPAAPASMADDTKKPVDLNATHIADATGVAQAPNLLRVNDSPDQKDGAMGVHSNILMPLCSVVLAAAGAIFLL